MPRDSPLLLYLPPHLHKWTLHHNQDRYCSLHVFFFSVLSVNFCCHDQSIYVLLDSRPAHPSLFFHIDSLTRPSPMLWFKLCVCVWRPVCSSFLSGCQSWLLSSLLLSSQFAAGPRALHQQVLTLFTFPQIPSVFASVVHAFSPRVQGENITEIPQHCTSFLHTFVQHLCRMQKPFSLLYWWHFFVRISKFLKHQFKISCVITVLIRLWQQKYFN